MPRSNAKAMTPDERKRMLAAIVKHSDDLTEIARRYDRLRYVCEKKNASDAILNLTATAGAMTLDQLAQLGTLLEIMREAFKECPCGERTDEHGCPNGH